MMEKKAPGEYLHLFKKVVTSMIREIVAHQEKSGKVTTETLQEWNDALTMLRIEFEDFSSSMKTDLQSETNSAAVERRQMRQQISRNEIVLKQLKTELMSQKTQISVLETQLREVQSSQFAFG